MEQAKSLFEVLAISDKVLLIRTPIDDPKPISNFFGMDSSPNTMQLSMDTGAGDVLPEPREPTVGMVLKLNGSRAGYHYKDTWDWFRKGEGILNLDEPSFQK